MPIHDWTRVDAGLFHHFHQAWTIELSGALNAGSLPPDYFALAEQIIGGPIPDVVTLQRSGPRREARPDRSGSLALADAPPKAHFIMSAEIDRFAQRASRIIIKHRLGHVVAVIEIVSPGNKSSASALRAFASKAYELLSQGINLLVVDLFPPSPRDPQGIHKVIWDEIADEPFALPAGKSLTVAAYDASDPKTAYVEPVAVGDVLPDLPIFLSPGLYVLAPLESSYQTTWSKCPEILREVVTGSLSEE